jgi:FkbM family methyltransferase
MWLLAVVGELTVRRKLRRPARADRTVRLVVGGMPVAFSVRDIGELHGLREVFVDGVYSLEPARTPRTILDLGGNIGAAAVQFATRWPDARIVVVEPDPDAFSRLVRNVRRFERIETVRAAAGPEDGLAHLHRTGYTLTSSVLPEAPGPTIEVRALSLDSLLDGPCQGSADLVKIDIEGAELAVLAACLRRASIPTLVGELHTGTAGDGVATLEGLLTAHSVETEPLPNGEVAFRAMLKRP